MAHPLVWPGAGKLMSNLNTYRTAPVLPEIKACPDRECYTGGRQKNSRGLNEGCPRHKVSASPPECCVVVEHQVGSNRDGNTVKQTKAKRGALLRAFGPYPGDQSHTPKYCPQKAANIRSVHNSSPLGNTKFPVRLFRFIGSLPARRHNTTAPAQRTAEHQYDRACRRVRAILCLNLLRLRRA